MVAMNVTNGTIIETMKGIINDIRYKKLENFTPYVIRNFIIDIICIIHANPVKISNNMMKIANNCFLKYLLIMFIIQSIKPKFAPVKNNSIRKIFSAKNCTLNVRLNQQYFLKIFKKIIPDFWDFLFLKIHL